MNPPSSGGIDWRESQRVDGRRDPSLMENTRPWTSWPRGSGPPWRPSPPRRTGDGGCWSWASSPAPPWPPSRRPPGGTRWPTACAGRSSPCAAPTPGRSRSSPPDGFKPSYRRKYKSSCRKKRRELFLYAHFSHILGQSCALPSKFCPAFFKKRRVQGGALAGSRWNPGGARGSAPAGTSLRDGAYAGLRQGGSGAWRRQGPAGR